MRDESEWIVVPDCHEAIVNNVEYEKARAAIRKIGHYERDNKDYLLPFTYSMWCVAERCQEIQEEKKLLIIVISQDL